MKLPQFRVTPLKLIWLLLMVTVVAPAFMTAAALDMVTSYDHAVHIVFLEMIRYLHIPIFIADYLAYPVAALGMLLPTTAAFIHTLFMMFFGGDLAAILTYCFFAGVAAPMSLRKPEEQDEQEEQEEGGVQ